MFCAPSRMRDYQFYTVYFSLVKVTFMFFLWKSSFGGWEGIADPLPRQTTQLLNVAYHAVLEDDLHPVVVIYSLRAKIRDT